MQVETKIEIKYCDLLGDDFDDATSEKDMKDLIEQHIKEYCDEHKINRADIKIKE